LENKRSETEPVGEPVLAADVEPGNVLVLDGAEVAVTSLPVFGSYWINAARVWGVAIDWQTASSRGRIFRLASDVLYRVPSGGAA
jgi:hypothetical protein